jgi:hypothetical protein
MEDQESSSRRVIWLVVRGDEVAHGEWFTSERQARLKRTWLEQVMGVGAKVIRAVLEPARDEQSNAAGCPHGDA